MADSPAKKDRSKLIGLGIVAVILAVFVLINFDKVTLHLVFAKVQIRLAWALVIAGALGFVTGWLAQRLKD